MLQTIVLVFKLFLSVSSFFFFFFIRKGTGITKYEMLKSGAVPDYTNVAYREAVSRLRYLLHESYVPSQPSLPVKYSVVRKFYLFIFILFLCTLFLCNKFNIFIELN